MKKLTLIFALLCASVAAYGQILFQVSSQGAGGGGTSNNVVNNTGWQSCGNNVSACSKNTASATVGNYLLVTVMFCYDSGCTATPNTPTSVTDGANTYTLINKNLTTSAASPFSYLAPVTTGGARTVVVTFANTSNYYAYMQIVELTGLGWPNQSVFASGCTSTSPSLISPLTQADNEFIYAAAAGGNALSYGAGATGIAGTGTGYADEYRMSGAAGNTYSLSFGMTTGSGICWNEALIAFPPSGTQSLMAAWKMTEGSGTSVADSSGNSRNITLTNATWNATGPGGTLTKAVIFNGSTTTAIPSSGAGITPDYNTPFTFSAWVYNQDTSNTYPRLYSTLNASTKGLETGLQWMTSSYAPIFLMCNTYSTNCISITANTSVSINAWHMLTWTYDGSSKLAGVKTYVDGTLISTSQGAIYDSLTASISIGNIPRVGGRPTQDATTTLNGRIAGVCYNNRVLTQAEVTSEYSSPGTCITN